MKEITEAEFEEHIRERKEGTQNEKDREVIVLNEDENT